MEAGIVIRLALEVTRLGSPVDWTDTLEATAYFLDLTVGATSPSSDPVALQKLFDR